MEFSKSHRATQRKKFQQQKRKKPPRLRTHKRSEQHKKVMMENGKNMCGWHSDVYTPP